MTKTSSDSMPARDVQTLHSAGTQLDTLLARAQQGAAEGNLQEARLVYDKALRLCRVANDPIGEARVQQRIGDLERTLGHLHDAEDAYGAALAIYQREGNAVGEADASLSRGDARRARSLEGEAAIDYLVATKLYEGVGSTLGSAHARFKLAQVKASDSDAAKQHFERAAELYEQADREAGPPSTLRLKNPPLPEPVGDCRRIEPWLMGKVARRELAKLQPEIPEASAAEESQRPARWNIKDILNDLSIGGAACGTVVLLLRGGVFITTMPMAELVPFRHLLYGGIAAVAATASVFLVRQFDVRRLAVEVATGLATFALAFYTSATILDMETRAVTEHSLDQGLDSPPSATAQSVGTLLKFASQIDIDTHPDEARESYEQALTMSRKAGQLQGMTSTLLAYARFEHYLHREDDARELYGQALDATRKATDRSAQVEVLGAAASFENSARQFARGRELNTELACLSRLQLAEKLGDRRAEAAALVSLGNLHRTSRQTSLARIDYDKALAVFRQLDDKKAQARVDLLVARVAGAADQMPQARQACAAALSLYEQQEDPAGQAAAYRRLGHLEETHGDLGAAHAAYDQAQSFYAKAGDDVGLATVFRAVGNGERRAGRLQEAADLFSKALALFRQHQSLGGEASVLLSIGMLKQTLDHGDEARDAFTAAARLQALRNKPGREAVAQFKLGELEAQLGHTAEARQAYERALLLNEELEDLGAQMTALQRLATLLKETDANAAQHYLALSKALPRLPV